MGCFQIQANTGYDKSAVCKKDAECNDRSKIGVLQSISCDLECFNYLAWDVGMGRNLFVLYFKCQIF